MVHMKSSEREDEYGERQTGILAVREMTMGSWQG
jgi:hypothetical protein